MKAQFKVAAYCVSSIALAFTLSTASFAQTTPPAKVLAENSKATVTDGTVVVGATVTPGAMQGPFLARYYLSSGTLEYTYADGTKEKVTRKAGTALILSSSDKRPTSIKNIGKTALHYINVLVK